MKGRRALIFAGLFGLLAALATYFYIAQERRLLFGGFDKQPVVIATQNILPNTPINSTMVTIALIPKPFIQPKAVQSTEAVEGFVATAPIFQGEQVLDTKLAKPGEGVMSISIPREKRAFTISINEVTGVGGLIRVGDRVDILGTFQVSDKKTRLVSRAETITLLQNIKILAVGKNYVQDSTGTDAGARSSVGAPVVKTSDRTNFSNITLELTPRETMDLALAQQLGVISLSLRSFYDRPGKVDPGLKQEHSTPASVTGIEEPLNAGTYPKWLEMRGESGVFVP